MAYNDVRSTRPLWGNPPVTCGFPSQCVALVFFVAATKQLYEWLSPSVCPSHLSHYVLFISSSFNFQELLPMPKVFSMQKVKVRGQRLRSQKSKPNSAISGP